METPSLVRVFVVVPCGLHEIPVPHAKEGNCVGVLAHDILVYLPMPEFFAFFFFRCRIGLFECIFHFQPRVFKPLVVARARLDVRSGELTSVIKGDTRPNGEMEKLMVESCASWDNILD